MPNAPAKLTSAQRDLVRDNIGLVGLHMRRVGDLSHLRRDRENHDLFQEGCLGLIRAAQRYPGEHRMPFAAFALPRIHNAVSAAIYERFRTVRMPTHRKGITHPKEENLTDAMADALAERANRDVGDRRDRFLLAARAASKRIRLRKGVRSGKINPLRLLVDRHIFAEEGYRMSLRQIARDSGRGYATINGLLRRLCTFMRQELKGGARC